MSYRAEKLKMTFDFEVKFDLEGQGQSPPKTIGILTKVFYTYGPNLVILAWTGDELSRGQASDYRTHGRTDTQTDAGNDNTRRPKLASGKNTIKGTINSGMCTILLNPYPVLPNRSPLFLYLCMSMIMPPNSCGNMQKHGYLCCFHTVATRENIPRFHLIERKVNISNMIKYRKSCSWIYNTDLL